MIDSKETTAFIFIQFTLGSGEYCYHHEVNPLLSIGMIKHTGNET